ncbi:hypothetical protein IWW57_003774 [Coemansia sp. S610]|nr:hypothetical protein IWW57_003774 [Coemansia sp. S610]KAJ2698746.1 hypothetical protein H4218_003067 [Coemansia sp. IMI 209128]
MQCSDISNRQLNLLLQCYCKTDYNTNFYNYKEDEGIVVCTRGDGDDFHTNTTEVCQNYQKYSNCPGIDISPNSAPPKLGVTKVALLAIALSSLMFM